MNYLEEITKRFPIRRKQEQKKAFRDWAVEEIRSLGYSVKVEQSGLQCHENIIVGNPEKAPVLFTTHYDTPAATLLPDIQLPRNPLLNLLYQMLIVLILLMGAAVTLLLVGALTGDPDMARILWMVTYLGILLWMSLGGVPNKNNVNDNTSGLAALMTLMAQLPPEERVKAAFILFDNEEKGLGGSKSYTKEHQQVAYTRMTVNLNCVGVGENILVISRKLARQHREFAFLEKHMKDIATHRVHFFDSLGSVCNSSWKSFKCGVNIGASKYLSGIGFYTPNLHTKRDTHADAGNIAAIAGALCACVQEMTM